MTHQPLHFTKAQCFTFISACLSMLEWLLLLVTTLCALQLWMLLHWLTQFLLATLASMLT